MKFKLIITYGEQTNAQRGCVFVWPGASLARSSDLHSSPRWRISSDTRCVGVATKSPRSNKKPLAGVTADDGSAGLPIIPPVRNTTQRFMKIWDVFVTFLPPPRDGRGSSSNGKVVYDAGQGPLEARA